jgi:hypothetical protein
MQLLGGELSFSLPSNTKTLLRLGYLHHYRPFVPHLTSPEISSK